MKLELVNKYVYPKSTRESTTSEILEIINNVAIIAVVLVKKLPADLEDIKLSCETPIPRAPPSDFCNKTRTISIIAKITSIIKIKFSISVIYSNFLLYQ